jgi:hypothetical protein
LFTLVFIFSRAQRDVTFGWVSVVSNFNSDEDELDEEKDDRRDLVTIYFCPDGVDLSTWILIPQYLQLEFMMEELSRPDNIEEQKWLSMPDVDRYEYLVSYFNCCDDFYTFVELLDLFQRTIILELSIFFHLIYQSFNF